MYELDLNPFLLYMGSLKIGAGELLLSLLTISTLIVLPSNSHPNIKNIKYTLIFNNIWYFYLKLN